MVITIFGVPMTKQNTEKIRRVFGSGMNKSKKGIPICINAITKAKILAKGRQIDAIDFSNMPVKEKITRLKALYPNDRCFARVIEEDYKGELEAEQERERKLALIGAKKNVNNAQAG